jgi:predicted permease
MQNIFFTSFQSMFFAIAQIFLIAFFAGILVRKKIIKEENIKGISDVVVKILLPSMVFSNIITSFKPSETPNWWILPLLGIFLPVIFLGISRLFFIKNFKNKLNIISVGIFQNAGYLVLPIGKILYPNQFDQFALYTFLFILGFNPILWSLGKVLVTQKKEDKKFEIKDIITPPLIANLVALFFVFTKINTFIPEVIIAPITLLGSATVPMAMFVLGATLGTVSLKNLPPFFDIIKIVVIKYVIIPVFVIGVLYYFNISKTSILLADFLVIEATAAPAANLILMVKKYGGDSQKVGGAMLIVYILAIPIMPLWIAVWKLIQ